MALEAGTYISDLVITNPLTGDARSEGDDHIRLIKSVIKATFPNINGPVTPTPAVLNSLQAQITALDAAKASMPATTQCLFYQAAAPTGWTKVITQDDKALRVVSGTGGVAGGVSTFSAVFASRPITGTVDYHQLTIAEMPSHTHNVGNAAQVWAGQGAPQSFYSGMNWGVVSNQFPTIATGGGGWHNHPFSAPALNMAVQYIDIILASRN